MIACRFGLDQFNGDTADPFSVHRREVADIAEIGTAVMEPTLRLFDGAGVIGFRRV